jgi:hypothetical protein
MGIGHTTLHDRKLAMSDLLLQDACAGEAALWNLKTTLLAACKQVLAL